LHKNKILFKFNLNKNEESNFVFSNGNSFIIL
jgi:hypothetical protein